MINARMSEAKRAYFADPANREKQAQAHRGGLSFEEYFWSRVDQSGGPTACHPWLGSLDSHGYGVLCRVGRTAMASRVAWELTYGPIPEGLFVCHKCDVPACENPAHLFVGTQLENMSDAIQKGRTHRGGGTVKTKLHAPIFVDGVRGWPLPDRAYDPCGPDSEPFGWLPWGVIVERGAYLGLYSCASGHSWNVWCSEVAGADDPGLRAFPISPIRTVPSGDALARIGIRGDANILVIDWTPIYRAEETP